MIFNKHEVPQEQLDSLLADHKKPEDLNGEKGLPKQPTKLPWEKALDSELAEHLGHHTHTKANRAGKLLLGLCLSNAVRPKPVVFMTDGMLKNTVGTGLGVSDGGGGCLLKCFRPVEVCRQLQGSAGTLLIDDWNRIGPTRPRKQKRQPAPTC